MKKAPLFCVLLVAAALASGQEVKESEVSPATRRYRQYRLTITEPAYGLAKVKAAIRRIKPVEKDDASVLASPDWGRWTDPERFTYCMIHGEVSQQVCDVPPWVMDEEHKIFGQLTAFFDEQAWSDRQRAFLAGKRPETLRLMRDTVRKSVRVGANLKKAIVELGLYEMIPDLARVYRKDRKDQDLLTVMLLLMRDGKDAPFMKTVTYKKLYGDDSNFTSFIVANRANQDLTIERAMAYYRRRKG